MEKAEKVQLEIWEENKFHESSDENPVVEEKDEDAAYGNAFHYSWSFVFAFSDGHISFE